MSSAKRPVAGSERWLATSASRQQHRPTPQTVGVALGEAHGRLEPVAGVDGAGDDERVDPVDRAHVPGGREAGDDAVVPERAGDRLPDLGGGPVSRGDADEHMDGHPFLRGRRPHLSTAIVGRPGGGRKGPSAPRPSPFRRDQPEEASGASSAGAGDR